MEIHEKKLFEINITSRYFNKKLRIPLQGETLFYLYPMLYMPVPGRKYMLAKTSKNSPKQYRLYF